MAQGSPREAGTTPPGYGMTGKPLCTLKGHSDDVSSVAFSPDGARIISGGFDKTARVWDVQTSREILTLQGHTQPVSSVAFSSDGKRIVTGSNDNTGRVWDAQTGREIL